MYELFVLGELMDQPMHGYLLHSIIRMALGPIRQMSWGALYPLFRRLEENGLIAPEPGDGAGGRQRKLYSITQAGRERFQVLMAEPGAYDTDYSDRFHIKMSNFDHVSEAQRLAIVRHYRDYVLFLRDNLQAGQRRIRSVAEIPEGERGYILRVIDHRMRLAGVDLDWIDGEIARLAGGEGEPTFTPDRYEPDRAATS